MLDCKELKNSVLKLWLLLSFRHVTLYIVNTVEQSIIFDSNIKGEKYNNNGKKESCVFLSGLVLYMHSQLTVTF